jgi:hypothetical protein
MLKIIKLCSFIAERLQFFKPNYPSVDFTVKKSLKKVSLEQAVAS